MKLDSGRTLDSRSEIGNPPIPLLYFRVVVDAQARRRSLFAGFDEVIVDSPPVLAKSDTVVLATVVDEVVLVLRAGRSTQEEARAARQYLAAVGGNVVGVILNAVVPKHVRYGYSYNDSYTGSAETRLDGSEGEEAVRCWSVQITQRWWCPSTRSSPAAATGSAGF